MLSHRWLQHHIALTTIKNKESKMSFCEVIVILQIHLVFNTWHAYTIMGVILGNTSLTKRLKEVYCEISFRFRILSGYVHTGSGCMREQHNLLKLSAGSNNSLWVSNSTSYSLRQQGRFFSDYLYCRNALSLRRDEYRTGGSPIRDDTNGNGYGAYVGGWNAPFGTLHVW